MFPKYLPMRIFELDYIRKMINLDEIHFFQTRRNLNSELKLRLNHLFTIAEQQVKKKTSS